MIKFIIHTDNPKFKEIIEALHSINADISTEIVEAVIMLWQSKQTEE